MPVLEVRLEPVGDISCRLLAHPNARVQFFEVLLTACLPLSNTFVDHLLRQVIVASKGTSRYERGCRIEISARQFELFIDTTDCVAELHSRIPQRIPDGTGKRLESRRRLLCLQIVDEQQIQITVWGQLASAETANRHERETPRFQRVIREGRVEHIDNPVVGDVGQRTTVRASSGQAVRSGRIVEMQLAINEFHSLISQAHFQRRDQAPQSTRCHPRKLRWGRFPRSCRWADHRAVPIVSDASADAGGRRSSTVADRDHSSPPRSSCCRCIGAPIGRLLGR